VREPGPGWGVLLAEIDREIDARGDWTGEARRLREAAGWARLGRRSGGALVEALSSAGLEVDGRAPQFESDSVVIRRTGATALVQIIGELLPAIREADRVVPRNACWRDTVVARQAVRAWRPGPTAEEP
jgi:hypothetical protein